MHDHELDRFKRDIHLVQYAIERYGYTRGRRESSRNSHVLRHERGDDKLVIRQSADGHWTYFSVRDDRDNGTIVDFVQKRGRQSLGEIRQELRQWLGTLRPEFTPPESVRPQPPIAPGRTAAEAFAAASAAESCPYLHARGIRPETLRDTRFAGSWRMDARSNVLFVHRDEAGAITGFEVKNRAFNGFAPGGTKTAWQSAPLAHDRALVVTESAVDALSYHQLHGEHGARTRYLSTGGAPSARQLELIDRAIAQMAPTSRIIAATDSDAAGIRLAQHIRELTARHPHVMFQYHAPTLGKDWNDVLQRAERDYVRSLPLAVRSLTQTRDRGR